MNNILTQFIEQSTFKKISKTRFWSHFTRLFTAFSTIMLAYEYKDTKYLKYIIISGLFIQVLVDINEFRIQNGIYNNIKKRQVDKILYRTKVSEQRNAMLEKDTILMRNILEEHNIRSKEDIKFITIRFEHKYSKYSNFNFWNIINLVLTLIPFIFFGDEIIYALFTFIILYVILIILKMIYSKFNSERIIRESTKDYFFDILIRLYYSIDTN